MARFVVVADSCETLGAKLPKNLLSAAETGLISDGAAWNVDVVTIRQKYREALAREKLAYSTDLQFASDNAKTDAQLRRVKDVILQYARLCSEADHDPMFGALIELPEGFEPNAAAIGWADRALEMGGIASWQTPSIQTRGDLAILAGACRRVLGGRRSDELMQLYGRSEITRERDYFNRAYQMGLEDTELNFDAAQCNRAIEKNRAKLPK